MFEGRVVLVCILVTATIVIGFPAPANSFSESAAPSLPSDLSATAMSDTEIELTSTENSEDESRFSIEWSTSGDFGSFSRAIIGPNSTTHIVDDLSPETEYFVRVRAYNNLASSRQPHQHGDQTLEGGDE